MLLANLQLSHTWFSLVISHPLHKGLVYLPSPSSACFSTFNQFSNNILLGGSFFWRGGWVVPTAGSSRKHTAVPLKLVSNRVQTNSESFGFEIFCLISSCFYLFIFQVYIWGPGIHGTYRASRQRRPPVKQT